MNLAFPYHDPHGIYNDALRRHLDRLQSVFGTICIGATPPTVTHNAAFVVELRAAGCLVAENGPETSIGDHSRSALRLAVEHSQDKPDQAGQPVAFLFLDRFLYALETEYKDPCLADLARYQNRACMVFERTPSAWATHPANYQEVERMTTRLGELLFDSTVDWCACALIFGADVARAIVQGSKDDTYAVWAEWLLLAAKHGAIIASTEVDWLAWEDPYWERVDAQELKLAQENDPLQVIKRIQMHAPMSLLMAEPRFREITVRREKL